MTGLGAGPARRAEEELRVRRARNSAGCVAARVTHTPWSQCPEDSAPLPSSTPRLSRPLQPPGPHRARAAVAEALRSRRGRAGARRGSPPGDAAASPVAVPFRTRSKQLGEEEAAALGARALRSGGLTGAPHAPVRSTRGPTGSAGCAGPPGRPVGFPPSSPRFRRFRWWGAWCAEGGMQDLQSHPSRDSPSRSPPPEWERWAVWITASDIAPWSWCGRRARREGLPESVSNFCK